MCRTQLEDLQVEELRQKKQEADARLDGWKKLREALSVRAEKEQAWLDVQKNRKTLQDDCRKQQQTVAQLKAQAEVCRKEKEEVQQVYDKQRMSCEDWAREARARLSKGDVCPVCGKEVGDDLKSEVHFVSLLEPVRALLEEKARRAEEVLTALARAEAEVRSLMRLEEMEAKKETTAKEAYSLAEKTVTDMPLYATVKEADEVVSQVEHALSAQQEVCDRLEALWKQAEEGQQRLNRLTKEREELTTACEQWHRKVEEADKAVSRLETELRMLEEALSREALTVSQCVEKGETLIVFTPWQEAWKTDRENFITALKKETSRYVEQQTRREQLSHKVESLASQVEHVQSVRQSILSELPDWRQATPETIPDGPCPEGLPGQWNALNTSVLSVCHAIKTSQKLREEKAPEWKLFLSVIPRFPVSIWGNWPDWKWKSEYGTPYFAEVGQRPDEPAGRNGTGRSGTDTASGTASVGNRRDDSGSRRGNHFPTGRTADREVGSFGSHRTDAGTSRRVSATYSESEGTD